MIFGNIDYTEEWKYLDASVRRCLEYVQKNDLVHAENGSYKIDEDLQVIVTEYETTTPEKRFWEAHRKYLDVHVMLEGTERIDLNFIGSMEAKAYEEEQDFLPLEGEANASVILKAGDYLVCWPSDGHRTAVAAEKPQKLKKAIFKVRIR